MQVTREERKEVKTRMETVEVVKVEVELTKPMVEAMENFIASDRGHADQTLRGFLEYLIRDAWVDLYA